MEESCNHAYLSHFSPALEKSLCPLLPSMASQGRGLADGLQQKPANSEFTQKRESEWNRTAGKDGDPSGVTAPIGATTVRRPPSLDRILDERPLKRKAGFGAIAKPTRGRYYFIDCEPHHERRPQKADRDALRNAEP